MLSTGFPQWLWTVANLALASCGLWAAITAKSCLKAQRQLLESRSTKSLAMLEAEVTELTSAFSSTSKTLRRLSSRYGMQEMRQNATSADQMPLNLTPPERKAWLRRAIAEGRIRVIRDGDAI